jgi:hypothetical protein
MTMGRRKTIFTLTAFEESTVAARNRPDGRFPTLLGH